MTMHALYIIAVIIYEIVVVMTIIHVVMDNRQPAKTMAWALVIYFVPVVGVVLYFFLGVNTRRQRMVSERSLNQLTKRSMLEFVEQQNLEISDRHRNIVDLFVNQNFALPFKDNSLEVIRTGHEFFLDLMAEMGRATKHIHIDMYAFEDDALGRLIADVLIDKAHHGVEVRVIYDDVGCWSVHHSFFERMRENGIEVCPFLAVRFPSFTSKVNYRNHRKMVVIDGRVGYIGGMNIAQRYVKGIGNQQWRDTMVKIRGGGVYGLQRAFLVDWYFVDRTLISNRQYYPPLDDTDSNLCLTQVVTSGPVTPYPEIMQGLVRIIHSATRYVYIETPYFLPNEPVLFALKTAAMGGVDVRIVVPRNTDSRFVQWAGRTYLYEVLSAGVKVYLYDGGFLHSKILVTDDSISTCGSTNIDFRSFENNFEANIFIYDHDTAVLFRRMAEEDMMQSHLLAHPTEHKHKLHRFMSHLWQSLTRLLSPLF